MDKYLEVEASTLALDAYNQQQENGKQVFFFLGNKEKYLDWKKQHNRNEKGKFFFVFFFFSSVVWCCAKLPCKVAGYVIKWACNYCKTDNKVFAEYSSFSDIDLDDMPSLPHKSSPTHSFHPFSCACTRTRHRSSSN
ncbi:hypothetical protein PVK06_037057 [Gossypium arboreum]|uniref:Uncharacterized protein n=1 Tax=Gossypium arboreum TaxID=29729 RepID=A0ABR0MWB5_GOSAR|nr:hypothetical protein PVK06_037057 [Gossypium arboreum]